MNTQASSSAANSSAAGSSGNPPASPSANPPVSPPAGQASPEGTESWPARIGEQIFGAGHVPVLAGPRRGADVVHVSLRGRHGTADAATELPRIRDLAAAPLLVEPFSAADLDAIAEYADGVVVGGEWMQDFQLLLAAGALNLPVVLHRGAHNTVSEWLSAVEYVRVGSSAPVVLAEGGHRTRGDDRPVLDLALLREAGERSGLPVVADLGETPWLAGAAVAAGCAGLWLPDEAPAGDVDAARDAVALFMPLVETLEGLPTGAALDGAAPGERGGRDDDALAALRAGIDRVDAALATLLERRAKLAGEVQRIKPVGGHAGRNPSREAQIVHAMAHRAPSIDREGLARIMDAVISAGLDAAEQNHPRIWQL